MVTKLYRATADGMEYWENWTRDGTTTVHWGRVGERGEVRRFGPAEFSEYLAEKVPGLYRAGFREIPQEDHVLLLVVVPAEGVPESVEATEALWDRLESWLNNELGWTGLGACGGVDLSNEMVAMADVVDADLAVKVLSESIGGADLPADTVIAVREGGVEDGDDVIRWPPERAGEEPKL